MLALLLTVVCRMSGAPQSPYARVLDNAMGIVKRQSLEPVTDLQLFAGAMQGMLDQLDENSMYFGPEQSDEFRETFDQQFAGIGIVAALDPETKQLQVLSPIVGSPAYRAGILARDRILKIGKTSTQGMSLQDAVASLRGKEGEPVTLTVQHAGGQDSFEVTLVREIIHVATVLGDTLNPDGSWNFFLEGHNRIGYVRITSFSEDTPLELERALRWLAAQDMRGLVLDLRNDPGGYLKAAVRVCDMLVPSGVIVTTRHRGGQISETYRASGKAEFTDFPIAVLVDQNTASAAEIVAACLQDHHRAVVVGQRTFGKGTVQEVVELPPGCGLMKFTSSSYWRPSGLDIQRPRTASKDRTWGVSPDKGFQVELTQEESNRWQQWRQSRDVFQPPKKAETPPKVPAKTDASGKSTSPVYVDVQRRRAVEYVEKRAAESEQAPADKPSSAAEKP